MKQGGDILVCLGNPPYDRQNIEEGDTVTQRKGGGVRFGDQVRGGAKQEEQGQRPIFADFTEPATKAGAGVHLKNLYNDYMYFWRWALWRLFEQQTCGGIVTFITASSYLAGPGFVGMREVMRRAFDDLWIIDLGGDNLGTRKTPNVFSIRTPVAIGVGVRGKAPSPYKPTNARFAKVVGATREDKLAQLEAVDALTDLTWEDCPTGWHAPFLPARTGAFFEWIKITDIFPYQRSGSKFGRPWSIAEVKELLEIRLKNLFATKGEQRKEAFKDNQYRKIDRTYPSHIDGLALPPIASLPTNYTGIKISSYCWRYLDRHFAIEDNRFNDRMGQALWLIQGGRQLCLFTMSTKILGAGAGIGVSASVPSLCENALI